MEPETMSPWQSATGGLKRFVNEIFRVRRRGHALLVLHLDLDPRHRLHGHSPDLSGWSKALWGIFVIILPVLGVFIYMIARGRKMQERKLLDAAQQKQVIQGIYVI
jgi:hypothetical protein